MLDKSALHRMKLITLCQAFDGRYFVSLVHDRETEATVDPPAIDEHGAGAALSVVAAFFRASKLQMLAQQIEQRRARIDLQGVRCPINLEMKIGHVDLIVGGRVGRGLCAERRETRTQRDGGAGASGFFMNRRRVSTLPKMNDWSAGSPPAPGDGGPDDGWNSSDIARCFAAQKALGPLI